MRIRRLREKLSLSVADYDRVRAHDRRFFVVPGHNIPGAEKVVEEHDAWAVVEKPPEVEDKLDDVDEHA